MEALKIEIFEKAEINSTVSDLDLMLNYLIEKLQYYNIEVNRYDLALNPEKFDHIENYALPVIEVNGEIVCAGAYDFNFLNKLDIKRINSENCTVSNCRSCPNHSFCQKNK